MLYGYTKERNLNQQIIAFKEAGVKQNNIFIDIQNNNIQYYKLLDIIKENDIIIFQSISDIGDNYKTIQKQWRIMTEQKKIDIKILDIPLLDTTKYKDILGNFVSDLTLQILSFAAKQEKVNIRQKQSEGIAAAKEKGVIFGRPRKPLPDNFEELYQRYLNNESITQLAKECPQISKSTLRLRIYERQNMNNN